MSDPKKQGLGLKGAINLPKKVDIKNKEIDENDTDKLVNKIHSSKSKLIRLSIDCPEELYRLMKIYQINKGFKSTKDYVLSLIQKDITNNI